MTQHLKSGLSWSQAEIISGQGIISLSFKNPPTPPADIELVVFLNMQAAGITADDLEVTGPSGENIPFELLPYPNSAKKIHLTFPERGPRGECKVRLNAYSGQVIHPFFGHASFDLYIDCPKDDCRPPQDLRPDQNLAAPTIDLTTKDYRGFLNVAQNWVKSTDPNWSDLSTASTEKMFLELLSHHSEMLSLQQDRTLQEASPETARERISVRRHAEFLGLKLSLGDTATSIATVDLSPGKFGFLPAGSQVVQRNQNNNITLYFHTNSTSFLDSRWNAGLVDSADAGVLKIAAWPDAADAVIPPNTKNLYLFGWDLGLSPGQRIFLSQEQHIHIGTIETVEELKEDGWVASPADASSGIVDITAISWKEPTQFEFQPWQNPIEKPFRIGGNVIDIQHGRLRKASNFPDGHSIPLSSQRQDAIFSKDPVSNSFMLRAIRTPESNILVNTGKPSVGLKIGSTEWIQQDSLWNSSSFDPHFTTEIDNDGSVWLIFGDGVRGATIDCGMSAVIPAFDAGDPDSLIELSFYQGNAEEGNIGRFALSDLLPPEFDKAAADTINKLSVLTATNITDGQGGEQVFDLDEARDLIPESIAHPALERCVTNDDYAQAAMQLDDIAMAVSKPLGGIFNTIVILCAPQTGFYLTEPQKLAVSKHVDALRMTGREHLIRDPDYVPMDIGFLICPKSGSHPENLREAIRQTLVPNFNDKPGFFHFSRFGFGAKISASDLLSEIAKVPGIGAVKLLTFKPLRENGSTQIYDVIEMGPTEIPIFAGQVSLPELGRLTVRIEGLDPPSLSADFVIGGPASETDLGGIL